jgi:hypothetical protein
MKKGKLTLPGRSKVILMSPVKNGVDGQEGIIDQSKIAGKDYLVGSLCRISGNYVVTIVLNMKEEE